jgi:preprotein translocase subunit SecG
LQSGRSAGLSGSIAGGGEALFGKKKGVDDLLAKITGWLAAFFMVFTLALAVI